MRWFVIGRFPQKRKVLRVTVWVSSWWTYLSVSFRFQNNIFLGPEKNAPQLRWSPILNCSCATMCANEFAQMSVQVCVNVCQLVHVQMFMQVWRPPCDVLCVSMFRISPPPRPPGYGFGCHGVGVLNGPTVRRSPIFHMFQEKSSVLFSLNIFRPIIFVMDVFKPPTGPLCVSVPVFCLDLLISTSLVDRATASHLCFLFLDPGAACFF